MTASPASTTAAKTTRERDPEIVRPDRSVRVRETGRPVTAAEMARRARQIGWNRVRREPLAPSLGESFLFELALDCGAPGPGREEPALFCQGTDDWRESND